MEWSNKKILLFLELLKRERAIWDPTDNNHRSKPKVWAAWKRLSKLLDNTPVPELKAKKRSLMATFRPLLKRKIASMQAGFSGDDLYQPSWFAFDMMESFLGSIYDFEWSDSVEKKAQYGTHVATANHSQDGNPSEEDYGVKEEYSELKSSKRLSDDRQPEKPSTNYYETDLLQKSINETFKTLTRVLDNRREEDECDLYAKLLAKKLRRYPDDMRLKLMYSIDGIMVDNPYPDDNDIS